MPWKYEIYRCLFVAFGMFEVTTNLTYLLKKEGLNLAKKQHGELPKDTSKDKIKIKVCCMLIYGLLLVIGGIISFINKSVNSSLYTIILILFSIYALCEAVYYRYWKTFGFATVTILVTALFIFL